MQVDTKQKVLVIVGPTASGKTALGIKCANLFNGEIISGDSIQVYKGLDIGSAKADEKERSEAIHHLIDIKEAKDNYSVADFQSLSRYLIREISSKNRLPIIVGGTGLYIKACLYDYVFFEEKEADDQFEDLSNEEIYNILAKEEPEALEKIHINNRKRLIRALNILKKHHEGISQIKARQDHQLIYDAKIIGLTLPRDELYKRIDKRIDKMMDIGLLTEISNLLSSGLSFDDQAMQAIGYKEFRPYFEEGKDLQACIEQIKINTRHFAKRQYTWFNNQMPIKWYENSDNIIEDIQKWLNT